MVQNIPQSVQDIWDMAEVKRTPVEWALQYLWNRDDVDCVLSGMTSLEQVKENIEIASKLTKSATMTINHQGSCKRVPQLRR